MMLLMTSLCVEAYDNSRALKYAKLAVAADASSADANAALGFVLGLRGSYRKGLSYLQKAVELDPADYKYRMRLCADYEMAGRYRKAVEACTATISLTATPEGKASAWYVRGRAYEALMKFAKAKEDFEAAKQVGSNAAWFYSDEHLGKSRR